MWVKKWNRYLTTAVERKLKAGPLEMRSAEKHCGAAGRYQAQGAMTDKQLHNDRPWLQAPGKMIVS